MVFLKKLLANQSFWVQKLYMFVILDQLILMVFLKKCSFRASRPFWSRNWRTVIALFFFQILNNEKGQDIGQHYINAFSEKMSFGVNGLFWDQKLWHSILGLKLMHHYDFISVLRIFLIFNNERGQGYMKVVLMVFLKKFFFAPNGAWCSQNGAFSQLWISLRIFFF